MSWTGFLFCWWGWTINKWGIYACFFMFFKSVQGFFAWTYLSKTCFCRCMFLMFLCIWGFILVNAYTLWNEERCKKLERGWVSSLWLSFCQAVIHVSHELIKYNISFYLQLLPHLWGARHFRFSLLFRWGLQWNDLLSTRQSYSFKYLEGVQCEFQPWCKKGVNQKIIWHLLK